MGSLASRYVPFSSSKTAKDPLDDPVLCGRRWHSILACPATIALPEPGIPAISIAESECVLKDVVVQPFRKNHAFVDTYFSAAYSFASG
jgi:hypothetical protein